MTCLRRLWLLATVGALLMLLFELMMAVVKADLAQKLSRVKRRLAAQRQLPRDLRRALNKSRDMLRGFKGS